MRLTSANISERNFGINTVGRSGNLLGKNESRASSMAFSGLIGILWAFCVYFVTSSCSNWKNSRN